ncbi:MAG: DUF3859 domain-containing protein [Nitrospiraceae bacterium]|nr:DUF3859 domain-containing protein [Nitrospiraceae bacterium]
MRTVVFGALIACALIAASGAASAAEVTGVDIVSFGIYKPAEKEAPQNASDDVLHASRWTLVKQGDRVPATLKTSFGIDFIVKGTPEGEPVEITLIYLHPTMTNATTGRKMDTQEVQVKAILGKQIHEGYTFDHDWELVTGAWLLEVTHNGKKLAEKMFSVVKP